MASILPKYKDLLCWSLRVSEKGFRFFRERDPVMGEILGLLVSS